MPSSRSPVPGLTRERQAWAQGEVVVGLDEVGRGAWAGPLVVGAAVLPPTGRVRGVRDSKALTEAAREGLFDRLAGWCRAWSVGQASAAECDALGMADAQRLAARRALDALGLVVDRVLVDGPWDFVGHPNTERIVGGDATCLSIATASVLAKVSRDRLLRGLAPSFPPYDFERNKGYPCPRHKVALAAFGPTAEHRRSWAFMDHLPWPHLRRPPAGASGRRGAPPAATLPLPGFGPPDPHARPEVDRRDPAPRPLREREASGRVARGGLADRGRRAG